MDAVFVRDVNISSIQVGHELIWFDNNGNQKKSAEIVESLIVEGLIYAKDVDGVFYTSDLDFYRAIKKARES